jgi:hypothetical protein
VCVSPLEDGSNVNLIKILIHTHHNIKSRKYRALNEVNVPGSKDGKFEVSEY